MYHDRENYTQPRDFPHRNSPIAYKEKGHLRPYVPRQGKLYAALRFPSFGILLLRIKGWGVSVPMYFDKGNYTQSSDSPFQNLHSAYKEKGVSVPYLDKGNLYAA